MYHLHDPAAVLIPIMYGHNNDFVRAAKPNKNISLAREYVNMDLTILSTCSSCSVYAQLISQLKRIIND